MYAIVWKHLMHDAEVDDGISLASSNSVNDCISMTEQEFWACEKLRREQTN